MSEVPTRIPLVCWHFKTMDVRLSLCRVTLHQELEKQSGLSKQKPFFCDESCLLETNSATALQAARNKTKTSDLGKFNSEKVSWKQPFLFYFNPLPQSSISTLCHRDSWCVCVSWHKRVLFKAVWSQCTACCVCLIFSRRGSSGWVVMNLPHRGGKKRRLNDTEHNTHS